MSTPKTLDLPDGVEATTIETDRLTFAVHRAAVGDPRGHVLLVPGWTGSKEDFTPLLPYLAAAGFDATSCDQRGQFETPGAPDDDYSLDGFGADLIALGRALNSGPTHLLGHSTGGLFCQNAVISEPGEWASLSLLSSGPSGLGESPERPLKALIDALDGGVSLADIHAFREAMSNAKRPPEIDEFMRLKFTSNSRESLRAISAHLLSGPDRVDEVAATGVPVWVGRGETDDAWPHDAQDEMAARLGTTVHVIADTGHSPAIDDPAALAAAWLPFLESR